MVGWRRVFSIQRLTDVLSYSRRRRSMRRCNIVSNEFTSTYSCSCLQLLPKNSSGVPAVRSHIVIARLTFMKDVKNRGTNTVFFLAKTVVLRHWTYLFSHANRVVFCARTNLCSTVMFCDMRFVLYAAFCCNKVDDDDDDGDDDDDYNGWS